MIERCLGLRAPGPRQALNREGLTA
jgi:hypothetical protein